MTRKRIMTKVALIAATAAAATGGITAGLGSSPASAMTTSTAWHNCPRGYVCVYPRNQDPLHHNVQPLYEWESGTHNLHGVYGKHYILSNQTGRWGDLECRGSNGTGAIINRQPTTAFSNVDLSPVNSIKLVSDYRPYFGSHPKQTC